MLGLESSERNAWWVRSFLRFWRRLRTGCLSVFDILFTDWARSAFLLGLQL
jgi:hypothetical protein